MLELLSLLDLSVVELLLSLLIKDGVRLDPAAIIFVVAIEDLVSFCAFEG